MPTEEELQQLVDGVTNTAKYRNISLDLVRNVGRRELWARHSLKEAIKATRSKLHQVGSAYLPTRAQYSAWERALRDARGDEPALRTACLQILAQHASTRERLPILAQIYARTLAEIAPVHSVLDIACGFSPLAAPWMPLAPGAVYRAYDIYHDLVAFLEISLPLLGLQPEVETRDVTVGVSGAPAVDVALLMKAIPCLEQIDKQCALPLLRSVPARHLVVSFPVRSLGGANRRMTDNYAFRMNELLRELGWSSQRFDFEAELVYLVEKPV
ncbi:MAG: 16S rRNA methyltransferase [Chloroflexi bacterium]|nr:16S rRNA methyltransferase [Chloroflexota bacterium]